MLEGLYESLITKSMRGALDGLDALMAATGKVDEADEPEVLSRHVRAAVLRALEGERDRDRRRVLVNRILQDIKAEEDVLVEASSQLLSLTRPGAPGQVARSDRGRPATPLSEAALLTNAHGEPAMGSELRAELMSTDRVDLLCAFVKWHGIRLLERELADLRERGVKLRVITTTYMGATERVALDRLVNDFGADVRVQYDALRTRLHAKAWLFRRNTGFDTAYVGSSNLSRAALLDGVEWNVRLSSVATPTLLEKFSATFDTYWNDPSHEPYDPATDRDRLDDALAEAGGSRSSDRVTLSLSGLDVRPYPHQTQMLESLDVERKVHGRHRNLIVAATGTGKTVVAALDFKRLATAAGRRPKLLFVAHRREILQQSLRTYREVLADASFGELYVSGARPERWDHVFASVQSLTAYGVGNIPADAYEVVVIDEFHHAEASTYRRILARLAAGELLGLSMKALAFCVSVAHAAYMTGVFQRAGIPSAMITGTTAMHSREQAISDLRTGRINAIFAVDVFNEGVDIPTINTVLFLRPTESSTVFLQQLGRGLRAAPGKAVLTALDFVGHHRKEFRFDQRYRALTGSTRAQLLRDIETGFPFLPAGSQVVLDRQTQESVLAHVKGQISTTRKQLIADLRAHPTHDLAVFLRDSGVELADVVRSDRSWTELRRDAGLQVPLGGPREETLLKRVRAMVHVDDPERARAYSQWLADDAPAYDLADSRLQAYGRMLFFSLWPDGGGYDSYAAGLAALRQEPAAREDLRAVIGLGLADAEHVTTSLTGSLERRPLQVHARYTREEVVAALDYVSVDGRKPNSFREGVLYSEPAAADAFFVTLKKSEADYSPTTMYRDYAVSPTLFHWESQSGTSVASKTGQRYLHHAELGSHVLLFARPEKVSAFGSGAPYLFLGQADYVEHRGERPIAITWRLRTAMPASHFAAASVVA